MPSLASFAVMIQKQLYNAPCFSFSINLTEADLNRFYQLFG